jgi:predicted RNA-binding protein with PIN domain
MSWLIDGYNLLHAMGILNGRVGPNGLEQARRRLLGLLHATHAQTDDVTIVFDAARAPAGAAETQHFKNILIRFAVAQAEADDLIEELIQYTATPHQLTVVSNDHRIQRAAQRRNCIVLGCEDYLTWIDRQRGRRRTAPDVPAKPQRSTAAETEHWLQEFAGLENEPSWKEIFNAYEFENLD